MYLLSQIKRNPAITTVTKRGIFGGGRGLLSSSLRNIKALLIYESGSLGCPAFERSVVMRRRRFVWPIGGFDGVNGKNGKYRRQFRQFRERFLPCSRRTGDDGFAVARHIGRHRNESVRVQCFRKRRKHRIVAVGRFDEKLRFRQLGWRFLVPRQEWLRGGRLFRWEDNPRNETAGRSCRLPSG